MIDDGDLQSALLALEEASIEDPGDEWILYRLAWVRNRLELHEAALDPARTAWERRPWDAWYLSEYMKSLDALGMTAELLALAPLVRGGGACRYYLAKAELTSGTGASASADFLAGMLDSPDDSAAADAAVWLGILLDDSLPGDSLVALFAAAVRLVPASGFYRSLLAERLAEEGRLEEARGQIAAMRLAGFAGRGYWDACASLARAEEDAPRRIWALRRSVESMRCPSTVDALGWALFQAGRDLLREGDPEGAEPLLLESAHLEGGSGEWFARADSLLGLIHAFQDRAGDRR